MPSAAKGPNENIVLAYDAEKSEDYRCPECSGSMSVVREHTREGNQVVRHFTHVGDTCSYESKAHLDMKNFAAHSLNSQFPDAEVTTEGRCGPKFADVLVRFSTPHPVWNLGICVECQYRNDGKNLPRTNNAFLARGFSVLWVTQSDFSGQELSFPEDRTDERVKTPWPDAIPHPLRKRFWGPDALRPSYKQGIAHSLEPVAVRVVRNLREEASGDTERRRFVPRLVGLWLKYGPHSRFSYGNCPTCGKLVEILEGPDASHLLPHRRKLPLRFERKWTEYGEKTPRCLGSWLEVPRPASFSGYSDKSRP